MTQFLGAAARHLHDIFCSRFLLRSSFAEFSNISTRALVLMDSRTADCNGAGSHYIVNYIVRALERVCRIAVARVGLADDAQAAS
jgi:hypothetical protein